MIGRVKSSMLSHLLAGTILRHSGSTQGQEMQLKTQQNLLQSLRQTCQLHFQHDVHNTQQTVLWLLVCLLIGAFICPSAHQNRSNCNQVYLLLYYWLPTS